VNPCRILREFVENAGGEDVKIGDQILAQQVFQPQEKINVIGTSKGRGFAGTMKRHHYGGGRGSHGSMFHRAPGSIGASAYPSRVLPGLRAAGRMGNDRVTVKNLKIMKIEEQDNILLVSGAVPGRNGGYVLLKKA